MKCKDRATAAKIGRETRRAVAGCQDAPSYPALLDTSH
jgi:hypothetical protein